MPEVNLKYLDKSDFGGMRNQRGKRKPNQLFVYHAAIQCFDFPKGPHFNKLPVQLILEIFKYLSAYELLRKVSLVCKYWYNLCRDRALWTSITWNGRQRTLGYLLQLTKYQVLELVLTDNLFTFSDKDLAHLLKKCTCLKCLKLPANTRRELFQRELPRTNILGGKASAKYSLCAAEELHRHRLSIDSDTEELHRHRLSIDSDTEELHRHRLSIDSDTEELHRHRLSIDSDTEELHRHRLSIDSDTEELHRHRLSIDSDTEELHRHRLSIDSDTEDLHRHCLSIVSDSEELHRHRLSIDSDTEDFHRHCLSIVSDYVFPARMYSIFSHKWNLSDCLRDLFDDEFILARRYFKEIEMALASVEHKRFLTPEEVISQHKKGNIFLQHLDDDFAIELESLECVLQRDRVSRSASIYESATRSPRQSSIRNIPFQDFRMDRRQHQPCKIKHRPPKGRGNQHKEVRKFRRLQKRFKLYSLK
ncbi:hypothetical protein ACJMK2_009800 [Sinanodonta woodiana]|uniref:F-box domain-containing protein n=1 Tax=Sinanodonta woodiana TaxID=1069815 RepID=A0ABD3VGG8_SINWO